MNLTAQIPGILADAASFALALGAIGAFLGLASRARPVRYAWRQLVADPAGRSFDDRVENVVTRVIEPRIAELRVELGPNGGTSMHDRLFARLELLEAGQKSLEKGQRDIFVHIDATTTSLAVASDPDDYGSQT